MTLDAKFNDFKEKYSLNDEAMAEMLSIFNDSFIELAHKLLQSNDIPVPDTTKVSKTPKVSKGSKETKTTGTKKWATKIAAEYAGENELTLDDFDKEKITKKDIDEYIKNNKTNKNVPKITSKSDTNNTKKVTVKEKCGGINKSGEPCNRPGTEKPDGSSKCFCFRHAMDWKLYEVSSDSDLEEEIFLDPNATKVARASPILPDTLRKIEIQDIQDTQNADDALDFSPPISYSSDVPCPG